MGGSQGWKGFGGSDGVWGLGGVNAEDVGPDKLFTTKAVFISPFLEAFHDGRRRLGCMWVWGCWSVFTVECEE